MGSAFSCCIKDGTIDIDGIKLKIKRELGEGGFAIVYLAEDLNTSKKYALKKINCHDAE
eukprot:Awhi_evm1s2301